MIINLPKLGPVNFRDDLTQEQFQAQLAALQQKYDFKLPKPEVGIGTLLKRGFMRGLGETGIALGDTLPAMAGSALGFDEFAQRQLGEARESRAALEAKYPTQFKSYTEIESPYEALQFGAETIGELGPTALTALVPGVGAGAVGSRLAASGAMKAAQSVGPLSMAGRAAAETAAKQAGQAAGKRAMYGGVYLGSFAQTAPEVFESIEQETGKMEPGIAALAGGLSSVLESIVPGKLLGELGGYGKLKVIEKMAKDSGAAPKVWKYIGKEAAKTAGTEGLTEAAQESINAAAEQVAGSAKDMLGPENIQHFKESFVKGAIGGGAFGTVSGTSQGLTARKEFKDTKEAEAALKAQYEAERKAGTLTPEKKAEYDIAFENARKQREAELQEAFRSTRESEMARMEERRPAGGYAPDAETQAEIDKMEAEYAKKQEEQQKADAEKIKARYGERGAPFSIVPPTTGDMFKPELEQQRAAQQQATRDFAFGPVATNTPGDPVTVDTLKNLKVSDRSELGRSLLGVDLDTVDGRRKLIQTLENPSFKGTIDEAAYDDLISTFDPQEVKAARAEMQAETLSPTKQKQQEQTRNFAFGAPDVTRSDTTPSGGSTGVVSEPTAAGTAATSETTQRDGDVLTKQDAGSATGGEGQQPRTLTDRQQRVEFGKALGASQPYPGMLQGRKNLPAQKAAIAEDFAGVVNALEKSKNATIAEVARRAKNLNTKIQIDEDAGEKYVGRSAYQDQMSVDGAKMHLDALNKLRELAAVVNQLPEGAALPYEIGKTQIETYSNGEKYYPPLNLNRLVEINNSMFTGLDLPEKQNLRTKEDFNTLLDAFERKTKEFGEDKLRITSTASTVREGVAGVYDADTDTIRIPEYYAKNENVLGHEIVHAQALNAVANPTKEQQPAVARLNKLYEHVKKVVEERAATDEIFQIPYGTASQQEFIAEGLSNPDFQYLLSRIPYENTTVWDKFVEAIAKLLGLKNDNAFTELLTVYSDLTKGTPSGTTTSKTKQAKTQRQTTAAKAVTPTRGTSNRPNLSGELPVINQKLGQRGVKLDQQSKDAKAYFGKVVPELALDSIANDLVYQPEEYRNSKMKVFAKRPQGPEPLFADKAEAAFFLGQGGIHAKNAEAWARANLSPKAVAFLDQKIAQYTKEAESSSKARAKQQKEQDIRKGTETQVAEEAAAAQAGGEYAPTPEEIAEAKSTKTLAGKRKKDLQRLARELESDLGDLDDIADTDTTDLFADADLAALHTQAHPVVLNQLENNNLIGALQALADSGSSKTAELFAQQLSKLVGNVNLVYGADVSRYDPATNTIYLRDGATEYEILHESSHATMSHTLDNPSHPVTRQVTTLFNQMKKGTEGTYGAQDIQEFAAEAWSNDAFRNRLKEFKPTGEKLSGWERLVNAVRQLLRLPPKTETALDAIDRMLNDIISPPPAERTGETLYAQSLHNPNVVQEMFTKMGATIRKQPVMNTERAVGFWKAAEKLGTTGRKLMYKALNLSALGDVGSRYLGESAKRFANTVEEMAGYQEKLLEAMNPLHNRLTKFRQSEEYQTWSTLVNDSTRVDVNPEADLSKYKGSPEKEAEWKQLYARFKKLTPTGQKLYHDLFATYKALDAEFLKSLERNIEATVEGKDKAASAYQKILKELSTLRIDHYAPLYREGTFWLQYDIDGDTKKETFESEAERDFARKQLEAKGATNIDAYSRADQLTTKTVPSGSMLADIMKIMKDNGAGDDAINDLIQLVVKSMPEASILKSRQKRTGIGGYIDNAAYVFDRVSSNTSRQLARMQYGPELQRIVGEMEKTVNSARGDVNTYGSELIEEFEGRRNFAMKPTLSSWSQYASSGAFYYNLAGNVSSAAINTLQTPLVVFPQLGGEYGFKNAGVALNNARKLYMSSGFTRKVTELTGEVSEAQNEFEILNRMGFKAMTSIENLVNSGKAPQYKELIETMKARGLLQTSTARDALRAENKDSSGYGSTNKLVRYTTLVGSFMFHHAERMNREITAVAAYDLEMTKLKNSKMSEAEKQVKAIEKALSLVEYAHGAGSTLAGPSLGQSDIGKVLMVFKRFAFSMYYMLFDTMMRSLPVKGATGEQLEAIKAARKQLVGIYGMSALFAGAKGLPLYWIAELAYNMFQDKDDDDFDTVMREFLGDFFYKGPVNYLTNLSIADRVGWTDLLWREQKGSKADASALAQILESALGAPYSIVDSLFRGKDLIAEGQYERGIEAMLPVALRNILKSGRYATEGANTLRGDTVGDVNGYNAAMQVLGFAPADLMKKYEENAYMTEKGKAIKSIEKNALKKYYAAMREGDIDGMMEAREKLFELGAKYPELKISENTITQSVRARERISNEMYQGVSLDRKLAPYLKQAAAEAYGD